MASAMKQDSVLQDYEQILSFYLGTIEKISGFEVYPNKTMFYLSEVFIYLFFHCEWTLMGP